jgi:hypothetical protein
MAERLVVVAPPSRRLRRQQTRRGVAGPSGQTFLQVDAGPSEVAPLQGELGGAVALPGTEAEADLIGKAAVSR